MHATASTRKIRGKYPNAPNGARGAPRAQETKGERARDLNQTGLGRRARSRFHRMRPLARSIFIQHTGSGEYSSAAPLACGASLEVAGIAGRSAAFAATTGAVGYRSVPRAIERGWWKTAACRMLAMSRSHATSFSFASLARSMPSSGCVSSA